MSAAPKGMAWCAYYKAHLPRKAFSRNSGDRLACNLIRELARLRAPTSCNAGGAPTQK